MSDRIFSEGEVLQLVGYLSAAVPELHTVETPVLGEIAQEGLRIIEDSREQ